MKMVEDDNGVTYLEHPDGRRFVTGSGKFGNDVLKALNLQGKRVTDIVIHIPAAGIVTATVSFLGEVGLYDIVDSLVGIPVETLNERRGRELYLFYGDHHDWKNLDGSVMKNWDHLHPAAKERWIEIALEVLK